MKRGDWETCTFIAHSLRGEGFDASEDGTGRGTPLVPCHTTGQGFWQEGFGTLRAREQDSHENLVAFRHNAQACQLPGKDKDTSISDSLTCSQQAAVAFADNYNGTISQVSATLGTQSGDGVSSSPSVLMRSAVRRLTPVECARLQGFPDHHARIPWRGKPADQCPDGPQYKAYGNSMAVPCMRWLGERIALYTNDDI